MAAPSLFAAIYDLGTQLCEALRHDRLEATAALVQERDLLINRLNAFDHPSEVDANWSEWQAKLGAQDETLQQLLADKTEQLHAQMHQARNLSNAHASYQRHSASSPTILHRRLSA